VSTKIPSIFSFIQRCQASWKQHVRMEINKKSKAGYSTQASGVIRASDS